MSMTEPRTYNVGDVVWWARCGQVHVSKPCTICFGKLQVTLILGNGDSVILPCNYCGHGIDPPTGIVKEWEYVAEPRQVTIDYVNISVTAEGQKREYRSTHYMYEEGLIFDTKEEALLKCEEIKESLRKEQEGSAYHLKANIKKTYSWNAGYHLKCVRRAEQDIEHHRKKAILCKAKAKEGGK